MVNNAAPAKSNDEQATNSDDKDTQSVSNDYKTSNSTAFPNLS
jgi:hypothetical protein